MLSTIKHNILFIGIALLILISDQITKNLIRSNLALGESSPTNGRFRLTYSTNDGGVFGLPINSTALMVLSGIAALLIIVLYFGYVYRKNRLLRVGLAMTLGGAVGNFIDRVRFGEVTDFIDVRIWGGYHWPSFNIADASLSIGMIALVLALTVLHPDTRSK